jgi:hypothetical protein
MDRNCHCSPKFVHNDNCSPSIIHNSSIRTTGVAEDRVLNLLIQCLFSIHSLFKHHSATMSLNLLLCIQTVETCFSILYSCHPCKIRSWYLWPSPRLGLTSFRTIYDGGIGFKLDNRNEMASYPACPNKASFTAK